MARFRTYGPHDEAPQLVGDPAFAGVNTRMPRESLPPGILASAANNRCRRGVAGTRDGRILPGHLNRIVSPGADGRLASWGTLYGVGRFADPNGTEWTFIATASGVYRCHEGEEPIVEALPTGVSITDTVTFTQAFSTLLMHRGRYHNTLVLSAIGGGFVDQHRHRDDITAFTASQKFAWGPWGAVSSATYSGGTVTVTTSVAHGFVTGQSIRVRGATVSGYNGRWTITVTSDTVFTYFTGGTALTTPATGTIKVSAMEDVYVTDATVVEKPLTALTRGGTPAEATSSTAHGLSSGDLVVIRGADQADYNIVAAITVIDTLTFQYTVDNAPTNPATGTITFTKVSRTYMAMPNGLNAIYASGRVCLPTSYVPGSSSTTAGSYQNKRDFLAPSDILDAATFSLSNEFRINQGDSGDIMAVVPADEQRVVVLKSTSVYVLNGVSASLLGVVGRTSIPNYGCANPYAVTRAGKDVVFVSTGRGVVSLTQTAAGELQGVDLPVSDPMQAVVDRIDWTLSAKQRLAYADNRLYWAVALDGADCVGGERVDRSYVNLPSPYTIAYLPLTGSQANAGLEPGRTYRWTPGTDTGETIVVGATEYAVATDFVYTAGTQVFIKIVLSATSSVATSSLREVFQRSNNAVLVFDYVNGQWQGVDAGPGLSVTWFGQTRYNGRDRLLAALADGSIALLEEPGDAEDQVLSPVGTQGRAWEPIAWEVETRRYGSPDGGWQRAQRMSAALGTRASRHSIYASPEGVSEERAVVEQVIPSSTRYRKPAWATAWDPSNASLDYDTPFREDYSWPLASGGVAMGGGLAVGGPRQETLVQHRVSNIGGRAIGYRLTNDRGWCELRALTAEQVAGTRREGTKA